MDALWSNSQGRGVTSTVSPHRPLFFSPSSEGGLDILIGQIIAPLKIRFLNTADKNIEIWSLMPQWTLKGGDWPPHRPPFFSSSSEGGLDILIGQIIAPLGVVYSNSKKENNKEIL